MVYTVVRYLIKRKMTGKKAIPLPYMDDIFVGAAQDVVGCDGQAVYTAL